MDASQLPGPEDRTTRRRGGPGGAPLWLWWVVVALVLGAVGLLVWTLVGDDDVTPAPDGTSEVVDEPAEDPADPADPPGEATETPTDEATEEVSTMPLKGPEESRFVDGVSAIPTTPDLPDGDYFAHLTGIDTATRTVTFDVEIMYIGEAAIDYLTANDPTAENPPPNDYVIVNSSSTTRTLPLADDVRIWDWCTGTDGLDMVERPLAEWAAAPAVGDTTCGLGAALSRGANETYWFDVRDGVVEQVVGQYLP